MATRWPSLTAIDDPVDLAVIVTPPSTAPGLVAEAAAKGAAQADEELSTSVQALRDEARKPLTPMPRTPGTDTDDTQFGDDADDRIMSARTRSG